MNANRIGNTSYAVIVAALVIGFAVDGLPDAVFRPLFCHLPARLAAFYYRAPLAMPELVFNAQGVAVTVTRGCGGAGFFALCAALLGVRAWQGGDFATGRGRLRAAAAFAGALAAAWGLATAVNAMRIVFIVPVTAAARLLPDAFQAAIHMAAGMAVFMSAFTLLWVVTERRLKKGEIHERNDRGLCGT